MKQNNLGRQVGKETLEYSIAHDLWREDGASLFERVLSVEEEVELLSRGCEEIFPEGELEAKIRKAREENRPLRVKLGIDPTATDLHLGHLIPVLKMRQFQELGHHAILIIGDYTAMVGDPTGRNKERPQLSHEEVLANAETYTQQVFKILDPEKTEVVFNGSWFSKMTFTDVIKLLSNMTVARMLEREDFANRMSAQLPISLHELVYPLMQGYDSAMIRADVELGGIDQKFNILAGRDIQREMGMEPQVGVCNPILLGIDGTEKMSKSLGNTIALNDPPNEMFGKTMSIPDSLMRMYYEQITDLPLDEIVRILASVEDGSLHPRDAKRRLAKAIVTRFYDEQAAEEADEQFMKVFARKELPDDMPEISIPASMLTDGKLWIVKLITTAGFAQSNGEARRLIQQGGVRLDSQMIDDPNAECELADGMVLQVGKRRFGKVQLV